MKIEPYKIPCSMFQIGWNRVIECGPRLSIPQGIDKWAAYDFVAGVAAAMYKKTLPETWLQ